MTLLVGRALAISAVMLTLRYRSTSLIRKTPLLGPCSRTIPRILWRSQEEGLFLITEVPLHHARLFVGVLQSQFFKIA